VLLFQKLSLATGYYQPSQICLNGMWCHLSLATYVGNGWKQKGKCCGDVHSQRKFGEPIQFLVLPVGIDMEFHDVLDWAMQKLSSPEVEIFLTIAWMIWATRNDVWLGQEPLAPELVGANAALYVMEYLEHSQRRMGEGLVGATKWKLPPPNVFKVNVAEIRGFPTSWMGVGVVVRDSSGDVLATLSEPRVDYGNGLWRVAQAILLGYWFSLICFGMPKFYLDISATW
jgi:hypothetical protein